LSKIFAIVSMIRYYNNKFIGVLTVFNGIANVSFSLVY